MDLDKTHFSPRKYGQTFESDVLNDSHLARLPTDTQLYCVNFRIQFPTIEGQDIGVIGDIPELGGWDVKKCLKLKWYDDHVWESA
jgi:hypothetical protein